MDDKEFRAQNKEFIKMFIQETDPFEDDIAGSLQATIVQFLIIAKSLMRQKAKNKNMISSLEIMDSQIDALRKCVIDLVSAKEISITGVVAQ